jgi:hypothetical protein
MNARTVVLIGAVALLGIGVLLTISDALKPAPPAVMVTTGVAAQQIAPYTVVTQDMVQSGAQVRQKDAQNQAMWPLADVVGKMTTTQLAPGDTFSANNLKPIEEVRYVKDLGLEVISFAAATDKLVGGELRPGHIINLYGYTQGSQESFTSLIEPRLWVVGVSSSGMPVTQATPEVDPTTGELTYTNTGQERPGTMITVAVSPDKAFRIIDALGSKRMQAWVTLAANQQVTAALATPAPTLAATPGLPLDLSLTATALARALQATAPPPPPRTGGGGGGQ